MKNESKKTSFKLLYKNNVEVSIDEHDVKNNINVIGVSIADFAKKIIVSINTTPKHNWDAVVYYCKEGGLLFGKKLSLLDIKEAEFVSKNFAELIAFVTKMQVMGVKVDRIPSIAWLSSSTSCSADVFDFATGEQTSCRREEYHHSFYCLNVA